MTGGSFDLLEGLGPVPEGGVYMDNNATTRVAPEVIDAMMPYLVEHYGNPSSMHRFGAESGRGLTRAREQVAELLDARTPAEIIFTAGGSESDNLAIMGTLRSHPDKRHVVTSAVEHPAVLGLCKDLEKRQGYEVDYIGVDGEGRLDLDQLRDTVREDTAIVSIMMANNETGVLFDPVTIGEIVKQKGVVFHVDAVQAAGKLPLDVQQLEMVDMISISGHKLHAPKGVGALYVRKGTRLRPIIVGGHQERGRRAGTENVASCVALGAACEQAVIHRDDENTRVRALRDRLEAKILPAVPDCRRNGVRDERLPNTANISFDYIEGEGILLLLDRAGIAASSGSACTSGSLEPSHVLKAMGIPFISAHGSIRFSLSRYNDEREIDYVAAVVPRIVERLRAITPFSKQRSTF
ncbi:cysteine desulfurase NifS [bacterium]|nr:cysteine desulfurase NifS [bacterium]